MCGRRPGAVNEMQNGTRHQLPDKFYKYFPKGSDDIIDYKSARSAQAFVEFLNENAGTRRNVDGTLSRSVK